LKEYSDKLESVTLKERSEDNRLQVEWIENPADWARGRKAMRALQYSEATQQQVAPTVPQSK
jgi:hypothetical protein